MILRTTPSTTPGTTQQQTRIMEEYKCTPSLSLTAMLGNDETPMHLFCGFKGINVSGIIELPLLPGMMTQLCGSLLVVLEA